MTTPVPAQRSRGGWVAYLARRAIQMEIGIWQSLYRFAFRRPRVPAGAAGFSYHRSVLGILVTFIAVSAIELVAVDVLVHRWTAVRIPLLVVGIWGLTWMFGLLTAMLTRPHAVGPVGIQVRYATDVDVVLDRPVLVRLPEGAQPVGRISLYADDPTAFLAAVRRHVDHSTTT
jgi:hypothetical protein